MKFEEFIDATMKVLKIRGAGSIEIKRTENAKINQVAKGIMVYGENEKAGICIYLTDYYKRFLQGEIDLSGVADEIMSLWNQKRGTSEEIAKMSEKLFDYGYVKDHLIVELINAEQNEALLREVPHKPFLDLAGIYRVNLDETEEASATAIVRNELMEIWGITAEQLYQDAMVSHLHTLKPVLTTVNEAMFGGFQPEEDFSPTDFLSEDGQEKELMPSLPFLVLYNTNHIYGTAAILSEKIQKKISNFVDTHFSDGRYFILPMSVHELGIFAFCEADTQILCETIREVNQNEGLVPLDSFLSNSLYYYDPKEAEIRIWEAV